MQPEKWRFGKCVFFSNRWFSGEMLVLGRVLLLMRSQAIADQQLPIRMNPHEKWIFCVSTGNPQISDVFPELSSLGLASSAGRR